MLSPDCAYCGSDVEPGTHVGVTPHDDPRFVGAVCAPCGEANLRIWLRMLAQERTPRVPPLMQLTQQVVT